MRAPKIPNLSKLIWILNKHIISIGHFCEKKIWLEKRKILFCIFLIKIYIFQLFSWFERYLSKITSLFESHIFYGSIFSNLWLKINKIRPSQSFFSTRFCWGFWKEIQKYLELWRKIGKFWESTYFFGNHFIHQNCY